MQCNAMVIPHAAHLVLLPLRLPPRLAAPRPADEVVLAVDKKVLRPSAHHRLADSVDLVDHHLVRVCVCVCARARARVCVPCVSVFASIFEFVSICQCVCARVCTCQEVNQAHVVPASDWQATCGMSCGM